MDGNSIHRIGVTFYLLAPYWCFLDALSSIKNDIQQISRIKMSAKALFVAKLNSHPFEDRVLLLDIPVKIGRSHRDDQVIKQQKTFRREQKFLFKRKIL